MIRSKTIDPGIWWFFSITFIFTWCCQLPLTLASRGIITDGAWVRSIDSMATFGPLVSAWLLTVLREGGKGWVALVKRGWETRFHKVWWIPILLLVPLMQTAASGLGALIENKPWPEFGAALSSGFLFPLAVIFLQVIGEEYGWRGYAIGRLQGKWSAVTSSLILGLFWGLWHLQLWMRVGDVSRTSPYLATQAYIFAQAILYTWLYNNSGGSVLPGILYHALDNFLGSKLFGIYDSLAGSVVYFSIVFLVAILVVLIWGPRRLVRGNQGKGEIPRPLADSS